jgi:hypothetical protein
MKYFWTTGAKEISVWEGGIAEGAAGKKTNPSGMPARPAGINDRAIYPPPSSGRSVAKEALVRQRPKIWFDHIIDLPPCQENFGQTIIFLLLPKGGV